MEWIYFLSGIQPTSDILLVHFVNGSYGIVYKKENEYFTDEGDKIYDGFNWECFLNVHKAPDYKIT